MLVSNSACIEGVSMGGIIKRFMKVKEEDKTCKKYRDRDGRLRYQGSTNLKKNQKLALSQVLLHFLFVYAQFIQGHQFSQITSH